MNIKLDFEKSEELIAKQKVVVPPENPCAFPINAVYDSGREQVNSSSAYGCEAGMSLRDYFASRSPRMTEQWWEDSKASFCWLEAQAAFSYAYADAMLRERLNDTINN